MQLGFVGGKGRHDPLSQAFAISKAGWNLGDQRLGSTIKSLLIMVCVCMLIHVYCMTICVHAFMFVCANIYV